MSLQPMIPAIAVALIASVAAVILGILGDTGLTAHLSAAAFAALIAGVAFLINRPHWRSTAGDPIEAVHMARRNTRLAALVYAWGAAILLATHAFAGLDWYHFYQYGLGAALFAAGLLYYVKRLGEPAHAVPPPLGLTALHGLAAAGGLAFLIGSGKVMSHRADWAANVVFLWGGIAIVLISVIALRTQSRLVRS